MRTEESEIRALEGMVTPVLKRLGFEKAPRQIYKLSDDEVLFRNNAPMYLKFDYSRREGWITIGFGRVLDLDQHARLSGTYLHFLKYFEIEPTRDYQKALTGTRNGIADPTATLSQRFLWVVSLIEQTLPEILARCTNDDLVRLEKIPPRLD